MKATRIYITIDKLSPQRSLTRAPTKHIAQRVVLGDRFLTRVASQDELIRLTAKGVHVIEVETDETPEPDFFHEPEEEPTLP